jgi:hypothetical protein
MFRDGGQRHIQRPRELAHSEFPAGKPAQHLTSSSMCKGAKNGVQFAPLIDHLARSAGP